MIHLPHPPWPSFAAAAVLATAAVAQHWSHRPLAEPVVPSVAAWGTSPLDAFAAKAMRAQGLEPSPPADRLTWLRRVTLDLTGLPPTPAAAAAFVADGRPDAAARVVDGLLASPAFAERWAAWWLDLARYADSQGYEKDDLRLSMWRYRDWVIEAFARDLPFDRFTIEQLAGDLLPGATDEQRLATAFHRQTMTNTEGGTDDEEFRCEAVVDRVDTTLGVWMGTTIGCARCHDHKYDPLSQREYFGLYAFFDQTADRDRADDAPVLRVPTLRQRAAQKALELELTELRQQLQPEPTAVAAFVAAAAAQRAAFAAAKPTAGTWQVLGPLVAADFHAAHTTAFPPEIDGVQLDVEVAGQRWRAAPEFVDGQVHSWSGDHSAWYLARTIDAAAAAAAVLSLGSDDALKVWWNGALVLDREVGRGAAADQELLPVALQAGANTLLLKVTNGNGPGGFYFDLRADALPAAAVAALARPTAARTPADQQALAQAYVATAPALAPLRERLAAAEAEFEANLGPAVPVLQELPPAKARTTRLHVRGSFLSPGDVVTPAVPACWPPLPPAAPRNRLGLAEWLVSPDNPLVARVLANRLWSELFGQGLVTTLEDFGVQGEPPSHPELLDWLACRLRERWSIRDLLRTIVLSATYGQDSAQTARHRELDPENRWLARGPAFRLPAEMVRDQALAVAGLLSAKVGGPSVMPAQPDGIWLQMYSGARWVEADGEDRHRRSLYTFWRRTSPHPAMLLFDAQSREACVLRRRTTNTPLQALVLWNEPTFTAAAFALGNLAITASGARDERGMVRWLWRQCLLREPSAAEEERLLALFRSEAERELQAAVKPDGHLDEGGMAPVLFALTAVAGVVLSLDEFVTRR